MIDTLKLPFWSVYKKFRLCKVGLECNKSKACLPVLFPVVQGRARVLRVVEAAVGHDDV